MVDLTKNIINPCYTNMKEDNDTKDLNMWEVPLNLAYITYTAKDAYACYEMYRWILDMRACLLSVTDEYTDNRSVPGRSRCCTLSVYKHLYHLSVSCISLCVVIICFVRNISFKNPLACLLFCSGYLLMYVTSSLVRFKKN